MAAEKKQPEKNEHGDEIKKPLFPADGGQSGNTGDKPYGPTSDDRFNQIRDLQKQSEADNSGQDSNDTGSKAASRGDLGLMEASGGSGASGAVPSAEKSLSDDPVAAAEAKGRAKRGNLYKGKEKEGRFSSLRGRFGNLTRRRIAVMAMGGLLAGGGIFGAQLLSGPFQFKDLAERMQGHHLNANHKQSDVRFIKSARYIFYAKKPGSPTERVRLGYFGNKMADTIETNMRENAGIQSDYENGRARYIIDPSKLAGTQYDDFRNRSPNQLKAHIESKNPGITVFNNGTTLTIDFAELNSWSKETKLIKTLLKPSGYNNVPGGVAMRIVAKRHGATLHPIKKADRKLEQAATERFKDWRKTRAERINNGDTVTGRPAGDSDAAKEGGATADEAKAAGDAINQGDPDKLDNFRDGLGGKVSAGGLAGVGVLCLLRDIDNTAGAVKYAKVVAPMIRMFTEMLALGSQGPAGNDITMEQLGYYSKQLHGKDSSGAETDVTQAESFRAEENKKGGTPPTDTVKTAGKGGSPFAFTNNGGLGASLDTACSTAGIVAQTALGILLGGGVLNTALQGALGYLAGPIVMKQAAEWLTGQAINPFAVGADLGNIITYGGRMMANSLMIAAGGRALSSDEEKRVDKVAALSIQEEFQSRSFAERMFDFEDTNSLVSQVAFSGASDLKSSLVNSLTNPVSAAGNSWFGQQLFSIQAGAQSAGLPNDRIDYDYGFKQYGFSDDEMSNSTFENPFENAEAVINRVLPSNDHMVERVQKCFGVGMDAESYDIVSFNQFEGGEPPDPTKLPDECNDPSENWTRVRFYIFDTQVMTAMTCYEETEASAEACELIGTTGGAASGQPAGAAPGDAAAGGTSDGKIKKLENPLPGASCGCEIIPKGITLHWWGAQSGQGIKTLVDIFKSNGLSVQMGITSQGDIYQLTESMTTKTSHAIGGNSSTIGIEIEGGPAEFGRAGIEKYPEKFEAVVAAVQHLKDKYNIPLQKNVGCDGTSNPPSGVLQHSDFNSCPGAVGKSDIDDYYYKEVMKRVK